MHPLAFPQLIALVTECGNYARDQRDALAITRKNDGSIVTQVDQYVEQRIVSYLPHVCHPGRRGHALCV